MKYIFAKLGGLPDKVVIGIVVSFTLVVSLALLGLLAYPSFSSLAQTATELESHETKLQGINDSSTKLSSEDKKSLDKLNSFLAKYVPDKIDNLHFATLNELIANAAKVSVSGIQIAKGVTPAPPRQAGSGQDQSATPSRQVAPVSVSVTYSSNFDSLLKLLDYWTLADQLVAVKEININGIDAKTLDYTISYELPVSSAIAKANIEDKLSLSQDLKKQIAELESKVIYTATPSANSVGKSNPFQ